MSRCGSGGRPESQGETEPLNGAGVSPEVLDQAAIDILVDAGKRGVDVSVIVSGIRNDNWLARYNSTRP